MIRFVLHPGLIHSRNDGDLHKITAPQLAQLYGVRLSECIVVDPDRPETVLGHGDLKRYLHLFVSYEGAAYIPVSEAERAQYPIKRELSPSPFFVRQGERRFASFRTTLKQLCELARRS